MDAVQCIDACHSVAQGIVGEPYPTWIMVGDKLCQYCLTFFLFVEAPFSGNIGKQYFYIIDTILSINIAYYLFSIIEASLSGNIGTKLQEFVEPILPHYWNNV